MIPNCSNNLTQGDIIIGKDDKYWEYNISNNKNF